MIRDAEKLKKIKEYRQVTQKNEILALTEEKMESNDWKQIMKIEGWKKDYKYLKEDYIKEELAEEYKEVSNREKAYYEEKELECYAGQRKVRDGFIEKIIVPHLSLNTYRLVDGKEVKRTLIETCQYLIDFGS